MTQWVVIIIMNTGSIAYFIKTAFKSMYKNALMTIASIFVLIACMIIIGSVYLTGANVVSFMSKLEAQNEIVAFIDDDYKDDSLSRKNLCQKVSAIKGVESVEYITKEQAFAEYRDGLGSNGAYLEGYDGEDNPLRNELRIKINDLSRFSKISKEISELDEIANIRDSQDIVDVLISVRKVLTVLGVWIIAILAVVSLFIISNTIKLAMHNRRNEINIMKYVGATNSFIRFPFILEGVLMGVISTAVALLAQWCLYTYAIIPLLSDLSFLSSSIVPFKDMFNVLLIIFALIGFLVGIFGSSLSMRKYLKV